jgi:hypothetical protein
MDLSDDGWMPPDGEYTVVVGDVQSGIKEKNGLNNAWVKPGFDIVDGEFEGRTFTDYYWIVPNMTEPTISIKNMCRFATCLSGTEVRNPIEAAEIVKAAEGEFLNVQVYRTTSKKTGKTYPNIRFCERLDSTETTEEGK